MTFEEIIQQKPKHLAEIARQVRSMITSAHPDIREAIYEGKVMQGAGYYIGKATNHVAIISPEDVHCKIYITHFDKIDQHGLNFEGKGSRSRHIKIFQPEEIPACLPDVFKEVAKYAILAS